MKCTRRKQLEIGNIKIGQVRSFKYLGAIINEDNSIEERLRRE
jgi:hypothetical protein